MIKIKVISFLLTLVFFTSCEKNVIGDFEPSPYLGTNEAPVASTKKGVAFTNKTKAWSHKTSALKPYWMYSWGNILADEIPENVEFVPMFWGKSSPTDANLDRVKQLIASGKVKYVLGFNEPDGADQANMTVDEAIALWPKLEALGVPLGSPATVNPTNNWMKEFMTKADAQGLRIDFITVHHYGGNNVLSLINKLKDTYELYGKRPIWITEFAVADWNATSPANNRYKEAEVIKFMQDATAALDAIDWVHRYAWFDGGTRAPLATSALFDEEAVISTLGNVYAAISPNAQTGPGQDTEFTVPVDEDELIVNGGFETNVITPWQGFKNGIVGITTTEPKTGNYCGNIQNNDGSLFQVVPVEAGKTYILKYWSKWRDVIPNTFSPVIRDNAVSGAAGVLFTLNEVSKTDVWTETLFEFTVPTEVTDIRVQFYKGQVNPTFPPFFLDDVSLKEKK